ncbi:MAG TPA: hypothetical protein VJV05_03405, partial [Pyrinomonadaceae bacterium]|nr:hypothetical protein [Pyrinomonadaceae bacterium]
MKYLVVRIGVLTIIAFGAVSLFGQATAAAPCFNRIGQKEWAILLSDLDPEKRKSLQDDAMRKAQVENMRELLAFACHATKLGVNSEQMNFNELEFIRSETIAGEYDKKRTKVKPGEPFSWITDAQVTAFYKKPANTTAFKRFYETKLTMMRRSAPPGTRVPLTNVDEAPAQDYYARMKIAEAAAATLLTPA